MPFNVSHFFFNNYLFCFFLESLLCSCCKNIKLNLNSFLKIFKKTLRKKKSFLASFLKIVSFLINLFPQYSLILILQIKEIFKD